MTQKWPKGRKIFLVVWLLLIVALVALILIIGLPRGHSESIKEVMRDGVLHDVNKVNFFGLRVNPAVFSAYIVTGVLLLCALVIRIFVIPRFKNVPGRFQSVLEKGVDFFSGMAEANAEHRASFSGAYIFSAGLYIFFSTIFELFGIQALSTEGKSLTLPAPLADINGALGMGILSFVVILLAGLVTNGPKGALRVLKDFSLPISMSFRLFGAMLSGLLITELVYHYVALSFVLPVFVGVIFTLLHAVIQAYVLATLVAIFYGEAVEPAPKKEKKSRRTSAAPATGPAATDSNE